MAKKTKEKKTIVLPVVWGNFDKDEKKMIIFQKSALPYKEGNLYFIEMKDNTLYGPVFDHVQSPSGYLIPLKETIEDRESIELEINAGLYDIKNRKCISESEMKQKNIEVKTKANGFKNVYINRSAVKGFIPDAEFVTVETRKGKQTFTMHQLTKKK